MKNFVIEKTETFMGVVFWIVVIFYTILCFSNEPGVEIATIDRCIVWFGGMIITFIIFYFFYSAVDIRQTLDEINKKMY